MAQLALHRSHDPRGAAVAAGVCGIGGVLAYAGVAGDARTLVLGGAVLLACGIAFVLAGNWVDPLIVLIAALPLPALYETTEIRIAPAVVMSGLLLLAWMLRAATDDSVVGTPPVSVSARRITTAMLFLLAAVALTAVFAKSRAAAAREVVNWLLLCGVFLIALRALLGSAERRQRLAITIGMVGAAAGLVGFLQAAGVLPGRFPLSGSGFVRATAGFGWPNELGMFLALALPYAIYARERLIGSWQRALGNAAVIAVVLGLLATFSRGSWLATLLAPIALVAMGEGRRALRVWLAALVICVIVDVISGGALRDRLAATIGDWVIEQRAALMLAGVTMFGANPLVGVGPGGFADGLVDYGPRITWLWDYLPTAQNSYVQFAAETGLPGVVAFVVFIAVTMRALLRAARHSPYADPALQRTVLWAFTTAVLLAFSEWIFAHGIGQLVMLTAAIGVTGVLGRSEQAAP